MSANLVFYKEDYDRIPLYVRIVVASLCLLLNIAEYDHSITHLLKFDSINNQKAISFWVLDKLIQAGFPYESCPLKKLATT
jgi:hypothetical protein